jgi:uncharacterized protein (DUF1697 family)
VAASSSMGVHIALLRGINVGGRNKLPMADLAKTFQDGGCTKVRTYIQSGNVIFEAPTELVERLPTFISEKIRGKFGYSIPVVMRAAEELEQIIRENPFRGEGADEKKLHVAFLAHEPEAQKAAELDPDRSPPDEFILKGREIFLHLPNGVARTKFTNAYFDSKLGTVSTLRNWRTTLKLYELASG